MTIESVSEILAFWVEKFDATVCVILLEIKEIRSLWKSRVFLKSEPLLTSDAVKRTTSKVFTTSSRNSWRYGLNATKMLSCSVQRVC